MNLKTKGSHPISMNWAYLGLSFTGVLLLAWAYVTINASRTWISLYVSLAFLLLAGLNSVAPFRALIDPNYVGYRFGLLQADKGLPVTAISGAVFLLATAAAFVAARKRVGYGMWLVAVSCIIFLVINGLPWFESLLTDPAKNEIQFGEYLTIPGLVASGIQALLFVIPFVLGVPWAVRRSNRRSVVRPSRASKV